MYILLATRLVQLYSELANPKKAADARKKFSEVERMKGSALAGVEYAPPFGYFEARRASGAFRVITGGFVTDDSGTGIVHCAPAFGEEDYKACLEHGVIRRGEPLVCPVDADGRFSDEVPRALDAQPDARCAARCSPRCSTPRPCLLLGGSERGEAGSAALGRVRSSRCPARRRPAIARRRARTPTLVRVALQVPEWRGLGVKEADKHIIAHLKAQGRIIKVGWRAGGRVGGCGGVGTISGLERMGEDHCRPPRARKRRSTR